MLTQGNDSQKDLLSNPNDIMNVLNTQLITDFGITDVIKCLFGIREVEQLHLPIMFKSYQLCSNALKRLNGQLVSLKLCSSSSYQRIQMLKKY